MSELRLGILGMSKGNGHPYSWSAIFNGYDQKVMADCPFPVIPSYLSRQKFPQDSIKGARVTHIWTQSRMVSEYIAAASLIEHVVDDYCTMIGQVDGVLLARDDAENHLQMSRPFLEAGLPVFIDKPIALNRHDLDAILALEQYPGQVFSCSAIRYAQELQVTHDDQEQLGTIRFVYACTPKEWNTYAVHIIEPVILALRNPGDLERVSSTHLDGCTVVTVAWSTGVITTFAALGNTAAQIQMMIYGAKSMKTYTFFNTFAAFRASLAAFVKAIRKRQRLISKTHLEMVVKIIEQGARH